MSDACKTTGEPLEAAKAVRDLDRQARQLPEFIEGVKNAGCRAFCSEGEVKADKSKLAVYTTLMCKMVNCEGADADAKRDIPVVIPKAKREELEMARRFDFSNVFGSIVEAVKDVVPVVEDVVDTVINIANKF